jgi:DNA-binding NtrC family response regulator
MERGNNPMSITVLLVDDDEGMLQALTRVLRDEKYQLLTALNGQEALKILGQHRVQILVADFMMPEMSGLDLLKIVKTLYPDVVRIMLTAQTDVELLMPAIQTGEIQNYMTKPWDTEALKATLRMYLNGPAV